MSAMNAMDVLEGFPLAPQQRRIWRLERGSSAFVCQCALEVEGELDPGTLERAVGQVVARHEILRTRYACLPGMELPIQVLEEAVPTVFRTVGAAASPDFLDTLLREDRLRVGDGTAGPSMCVSLLLRGESRQVLAVTVSSLCADEWSLRNLVRELLETYAGGTPGEEPVQYTQFSEWQNDLLASEDGAAGRSQWSGQGLAEMALLSLPFEGAPDGNGFLPEAVPVELPGGLAARIEAVARRHGVDPAACLLAAWQHLLARANGRHHIALSVLCGGRPYEEMHEALGLYARWPLASIRGEARFSFGALVREAGAALVRAAEWQEYFSWEQVAEEAGGSAEDLAPFAFSWSEWPETTVAAGVRFHLARRWTVTERFKMELSALRLGDTLSLTLRYDAARFAASDVRRLAARLVSLLESALDEPEARLLDLDVLSAVERHQLLLEWNDTRTASSPGETLARRFREQVARTPEAEAVVLEGANLTFREAQERAALLARSLRALGAGPGERVVLCLDRLLSMIPAVLGILESGAAFVPVDPAQPEKRFALLLEESGARIAVTEERLRDLFEARGLATVWPAAGGWETEPAGEAGPAREAGPGDLAYVIFTSGSTGRPKGVAVENRSVINLIEALEATVYRGLGPGLRVGVNAPLSFDASIKQVVQLLRGCTLCPIPEEVRLEGRDLLDYLERQRIQVLDCTPSQLRLLVQAGLRERVFPSLLLVGGEAVDPALWAELAADERRVCFNVYGPTECTVDVTVQRMTGALSIGGPLPNVLAYVLDEHGRPVPPGWPGELFVGGAGLARGYLGGPDLTAARFVPDGASATSGSRLYRTGDRVRWRWDGRLEFLGRVDHLVKIRGHRIEPGEIEALLAVHPGVREAVVTAREDQPGNLRLVAYVVPRSHGGGTGDGERRYRLPNGLLVSHQNRHETDYLYWEIFEQRCYARQGIRLGEAPVIFDVGANIGMFTLFAGLHRPGAKIYAFEPLAPIFNDLEANTNGLGLEVIRFPFGLSDRERSESFTYYPRYSTMSGQSAFANAASEQEVIKRYLENDRQQGSATAAVLLEEADELLAGRFAGEAHQVSLRRLSDVLQEQRIERIDLLKIDVQRAEMDVLLGIDEADWPKVRQVVMEVHDAVGEPTEGRLREITGLLERHGFSVEVEQDELLAGTDRHNLFAVQRGAPVEGWEIDGEAGSGLAIPGETLDARALREYLRPRLPEAMIPSAFVLLDQLPVTSRGKVDRAALPSPEEAERPEEDEVEPARTPFEEMTIGIWSEVLGIERIGRDNDFFELGGHSLLATQLMSRLRERFRVELPLRVLFESSTVAALAARVEAAVQGEESAVSAPPLVPVPRDRPLRLSFAQQRLWFLHQLDPESPAYNLPQAFAVSGALDVGAFARALSEVVRRHEVLRTVFLMIDGEPRQGVLPAEPVAVPVVDLSDLAEEPWQATVRRLAREEARAPFDLEQGPLVRCTVLLRSGVEHVVLLTMHHVVSDAWSLGVLIRELSALYEAFHRGEASPLSELALQYGDFAEWQRSWLQGEALEAQLRFWTSRLEGTESRASLPLDRPRTPRAGRQGTQRPYWLPAKTSEELQEAARAQGVTLFMLLLASVQTLLWRYGGGEEAAVVGTPIAGRNRLETEPMIGFFVNTLVLPSRLGDDPGFSELLGKTRDETLSAFAHQDLPFESLVEEIAPHRDIDRTPLFDVLFSLQNVAIPSVDLPDLRIAPLPGQGAGTKFDLSLTLGVMARGIGGVFEYDPSLFDAATVERLGAHLTALLGSVTARPDRRLSELPLLAESERHALLCESNDTAVREQERPIHERFAERAAADPERTAVIAGAQGLSYGELDRRSNQLARFLRRLGVGPEVLVGVALERSPDLLVSLLGVLKAGGAYLPLDPSDPGERLGALLRGSGAALLLSRRDLAARVPEGPRRVLLDDEEGFLREESEEAVRVPVSAENLAYVIYTSGSTGTPKGVMVSHGALATYARSTVRSHGIGPDDRVLQFASIAFDASVEDIYPCLIYGGILVLRSPSMLDSPRGFLAECGRLGLTVLPMPTAYWHELTAAMDSEALEVPPSVRLVIIGGEEARADRLRAWRRRTGVRVINGYGPTEATVDTTRSGVMAWREGQSRVPIGRAREGARVYLLDASLRPVPLGAAGEICVGGAALARGYLGQPDRTARSFMPDPFGVDPGERMYRTGDLARFRPDGELEFLGRIDQQVKVRGFRIEPGEIESALASHPGVQEAVVVARQDARGDRRLVAYAAAAGEPASVRGLREFLRGRLPDYMIPSAIVVLPSLPHTVSGKIDRRSLPAPDLAAGSAERSSVPPQSLSELVLVGIFEELLGVRPVGVTDDFFELGGHSLLATRLMSRVRERFRAELPLRALFESPTVAGLAERVDAAVREGEAVGAPPLVAVPRDRPLRLSFAQQRLWFLHQLDPESPAYNLPQAFSVSGALDVAAFARALSEVVRRHEVLRTVFLPVDGEPRQRVLPAEPVPVPVVDLSDLAEESWQAAVRRLAREEARAPFDLEHGPLLRCTVLFRSDLEHVVLLTMHHVVGDAWSVGVLIRELSVLYEAFRQGEASPLSELSIQYGDFAEWQRSWLQGKVLEAQLRFWTSRLAGTESRASLPLDRPRTPQVGRRGAQRPFFLESETSEALEEVARAHGVTPFMLLLASVQTLLWRYGGGEDVAVVGTPIAGRNRLETEPLIGFFVNTLVLPSRLGDDPGFSELLKRTREEALSAFAHQDVPFEKLVEEIAPRRDVDRTPFFDVLFALQNVEIPEVRLPELRITGLEERAETAKFDLSLTVSTGEGGIRGGFSYDPSLFDAATLERLSVHLAALLRAVAAESGRRLSELPLLAIPERHALLWEWNDTGGPPAEPACVHELVEAQAARTPEAVAVVGPDGALTYAELDRRAELLSRRLAALGIGPEHRVGVLLDRTTELVVALLAVLKTGGAYVPLDPAYPQARLAFMLGDSGAAVLLTRRGLLTSLGSVPEGVSPVFLEPGWENEPAPQAVRSAKAGPGNLAYLIYTSGSTGTAKAVALEHRSVAAFVRWAWEVFSAEELAGMLASTSVCFDLSIFELFVPLSRGGKVLLAANVLALPQLPFAGEVTLVNTVPSALAELLAQRGLPASVRTINLAGEPMPRALADAVHAGFAVRLYNLYGPSEDTTYSTFAAIAGGRSESPSIGRPIAGTQAYLLAPEHRPVPLGAPGELYLGGAGLARGYFGRPDLTAERFVPDPFSGVAGARLYRTGDLARLRADGELDFLGRIDQQVKVRGFRIEPGEIESVLASHPGIRQAAVVAGEDARGDRRLVAYVVPSEEPVPVRELRELLRGRLPEYMVPSVFVELSSLPRTASGKIDRRSLPAPELAAGSGERSLPPRSLLELELVGLFEELLGVRPVGVTDDFFELGGHSLLATRLMSRVRERFRTELALRVLFESPTVAALAERVDRAVRRGEVSVGAPPLVAVPRDRPLRLSFAQQRLWFLHQLDPESPAYNLPQAFSVSGVLDVGAFARALSEVVRRHEVLRTVFLMVDGEPRQRVQPAEPVRVPVIDLSGLAEEPFQATVRRLAGEEARAPFDLEHGPLLRCTVLVRSGVDHVVLLTMHHVVSDGWSTGVLIRELSALYEAFRYGEASPLPELAIQYGDFAEWQRSWLRGEVLEEQLRFWTSRLAGTESRASLPLDRPRTPQVGRRGAQRPFILESETSEALEEMARAHGVTPFMLLLASVQTLLWRYGGGEETAVVGTPIAGRNRLETEPLIGFFVNTLVLPSYLGDDPGFSELLKRTREESLSAFAHQDVPFEKLVEEIAPHRDVHRTPFFDVLFALQNVEVPEVRLPELRITGLEGQAAAAKFDLSLTLSAGARGIGGGFEYDPALFDAVTVERLSGHLRALLEAVAAQPVRRLSELPLLAPGERHQVLTEWAGASSGPAEPEGRLVQDLFWARAARTPEAVALVADGSPLSYGQLAARADRLARHLIGQGAGPEVTVGICLASPAEIVTALLAVLRAGSAFLPLDPSYPAERLGFILADARAAVVVTRHELLDRVGGGSARVFPLDGLL
ncbi:MAG TPA: amino acid adenylation domain-containing protein, partial [Thermoanaerobaculia bacterium]|nr:amino acid adenylation domain-containing protein [Thermoanaerobaculia bacterium]